ncbi:MAG: aldose 1-epimerase [Henriciella sp.]
MRLNLSNGDQRLELDPAAGGSVSALRYKDLDILRPGPTRIGPAFDPLQYSAFPMVPYVGRIHNGRFQMGGTQIQLHANLPPEPHAIHGFGWQTAWKVQAQSTQSVTLIHDHDADAWPWDYTALQTFRLEAEALIVDMEVENKGPNPMPAGLGWHPYFLRKGATLKLPTTHEWCPDETTGDNQPIVIAADRDLSEMRAVESLKLDTAFSVSDPVIEMTWPTHKVTLESDAIFSHATIYVPPGTDYFCAEPITHAPNAVNSRLPDTVTGRRWLNPGETLSGTIKLVVEC